MKFITVKAYHRGYNELPEAFVLNVSHIVYFHSSYFNGDNGEQLPNVFLETTRGSYYITGTIDELLAQIQNEEQGK